MAGVGGGRFPNFRDADVHIIINGSRQYLLHSQVLRSHSAYFRYACTSEFARPLSKKAIKRGQTVRWRFDLVHYPEDSTDSPDWQLTQVELNDEGQPVDGRGIPLDLENGLQPEPVFEAWDAILNIMYGRPIDLGFNPDTPFTTWIANTYVLIEQAEEVNFIHLITKPVEADFQSRGQLLHRSIAAEPGAWLNIALRLRSQLLFREALIHAVGQYNTYHMKSYYNNTNQDPLPKDLLNIITKKYELLQAGLKTAQMKMLSYYPQNLQRQQTVGLADFDRIGRNSYSNDIFGWMSLNIFRHFVSQNLAADYTHQSTDMGYTFFKLVAEAGDGYLQPSDLTSFYGVFPMTEKGKTVMNNHLTHIKLYCRQFASFFLENNSQLDVKTWPSGYFTCARVANDDYAVLKMFEE